MAARPQSRAVDHKTLEAGAIEVQVSLQRLAIRELNRLNQQNRGNLRIALLSCRQGRTSNLSILAETRWSDYRFSQTKIRTGRSAAVGLRSTHRWSDRRRPGGPSAWRSWRLNQAILQPMLFPGSCNAAATDRHTLSLLQRRRFVDRGSVQVHTERHLGVRRFQTHVDASVAVRDGPEKFAANDDLPAPEVSFGGFRIVAICLVELLRADRDWSFVHFPGFDMDRTRGE